MIGIETPYTPFKFYPDGRVELKANSKTNRCYLYNFGNLFKRAEEFKTSWVSQMLPADERFVRVYHENKILSNVMPEVYMSDVIHVAVAPFALPEMIAAIMNANLEVIKDGFCMPFAIGTLMVSFNSKDKEEIEYSDLTAHRIGGYCWDGRIILVDSSKPNVMIFSVEELADYLEFNFYGILSLSLFYKKTDNRLWIPENSILEHLL